MKNLNLEYTKENIERWLEASTPEDLMKILRANGIHSTVTFSHDIILTLLRDRTYNLHTVTEVMLWLKYAIPVSYEVDDAHQTAPNTKRVVLSIYHPLDEELTKVPFIRSMNSRRVPFIDWSDAPSPVFLYEYFHIPTRTRLRTVSKVTPHRQFERMAELLHSNVQNNDTILTRLIKESGTMEDFIQTTLLMVNEDTRENRARLYEERDRVHRREYYPLTPQLIQQQISIRKRLNKKHYPAFNRIQAAARYRNTFEAFRSAQLNSYLDRQRALERSLHDVSDNKVQSYIIATHLQLAEKTFNLVTSYQYRRFAQLYSSLVGAEKAPMHNITLEKETRYEKMFQR